MLPYQVIAKYRIPAPLTPRAKRAYVIDAPSAGLPASACELRVYGRLRLPRGLDFALEGFFVAG